MATREALASCALKLEDVDAGKVAAGAPQLGEHDQVVTGAGGAHQLGDALRPLGDRLVGPLAVSELEKGDPHRRLRSFKACRRAL